MVDIDHSLIKVAIPWLSDPYNRSINKRNNIFQSHALVVNSLRISLLIQFKNALGNFVGDEVFFSVDEILLRVDLIFRKLKVKHAKYGFFVDLIC